MSTEELPAAVVLRYPTLSPSGANDLFQTIENRATMVKSATILRRHWFFFLFSLLLLVRETQSFSVFKALNEHNQRPSKFWRIGVVTEKGSSIVDQREEEEFFFIRRCLPAEIGQASDILTDVFFRENTNFFSYQWERLTTYLSMESTYPKPGERHALFVACHHQTGKVLGLAEIDDTPSKARNATPRPYMYNVAVDPKWRRRGIARALVSECEIISGKWGKPEVYLKVRDDSKAAIAMYESMGYAKRSSKIEKLNNKYQSLVVMSKKI